MNREEIKEQAMIEFVKYCDKRTSNDLCPGNNCIMCENELLKFVDYWNAKQTAKAYYADYKTVVILEKYAVMRKGAKKPKKVFTNKKDAQDFLVVLRLNNNSMDKNYYIKNI